MLNYVVGIVPGEPCSDPECEGCKNGVPGILFPRPGGPLAGYAELALKDPTVGVYRLCTPDELRRVAMSDPDPIPRTKESAENALQEMDMRFAMNVLGVSLDGPDDAPGE